MAAYVVLFREGPVNDPAEMDEYRRLGRLVTGHNIKPLAAYGALTPLEGRSPDGVIILEFPSVAEAKGWYYSPEYQAAAPHRLKAADYRAVIVEGFDPAAFAASLQQQQQQQ